MRTLIDIFRREPPAVVGLTLGVALTAALVFLLTAPPEFQGSSDQALFGLLLGCAVLLQLVVVPLPQGATSFAGAALMGVGFLFGPAAAIIVGTVMAVVRLLASRGRVDRAVFDAGNFALSAAAAAAIYQAFSGHSFGTLLLAAAVAGVTYWAVNAVLLSLAMGLSEGTAPLQIVKERFAWSLPYVVITGLLAYGVVAVRPHGALASAAVALSAFLFVLLARQSRPRPG